MSDLESRLREQLADIAGSVTVDAAGPQRRRRNSQRLVSVVIGVVVLALAVGIAWDHVGDTGHDVSGPPKPAPTTTPAPANGLPSVTSTDASVRSLWQLDEPLLPTVINDDVVAFFGVGKHPVVRAVSARDGTTRWTVPLPAAEPDALGLIAAQGVVVAVIGHNHGVRPEAPAAALLLVIDAPSGRLLWSQSIGGFSQTPPVAVAANLVVTGDPSGTLNARNAHTGVRVWRRARPAACPTARVVQYDEAVAADGPLLAVSYQCSMATTRRSLIQRLAVSNGLPVWQWASPVLPGPLGNWLGVVGVASAGNVVVVSGAGEAPSTTPAGALGRTWIWPSDLGTPGPGTVVAFDATTGRPRWNEVGSQSSFFVQTTLVDRAVCESTNQGFECRDDVTGAPTRPVFVSGYGENDIPPIEFDRVAGFSDHTAAAVTASTATDSVPVAVVPIRASGPVLNVDVGISTTIFNGASQATFVVGAGQLSSATTLLLIRRVDVRGYPILAVSVKAHG
jgi:outer membrane protein assembly factor BamB